MFDSSSAQKAERQAADLAKRVGDGLLLMYVVEPPMLPPEALPLTERVASLETWAKGYLHDEARSLSSPSLEVRTEVAIGAAAEILAMTAARDDIEFVVVGSRGRNAVARLLLGSVASSLSHLCPKPLLIVRTEKA